MAFNFLFPSTYLLLVIAEDFWTAETSVKTVPVNILMFYVLQPVYYLNLYMNTYQVFNAINCKVLFHSAEDNLFIPNMHFIFTGTSHCVSIV